jgi:hypothetical protein
VASRRSGTARPHDIPEATLDGTGALGSLVISGVVEEQHLTVREQVAMYPEDRDRMPESPAGSGYTPPGSDHAGDGTISNMPRAFDTARASDEVIFKLVHAVVDTPATIEDYRKLAEIVQEAQENKLGPQQIQAKIRETTPFAGITQYLKDNHLAILSLVLTIVFYVLSHQQPTEVELVKPSIEDIIRHLDEDHTVHKSFPVMPIPAESPTDKEPPSCR